jgi:hypothetical protein
MGGRTLNAVAVSGLPLRLVHVTDLNPACSPAGKPIVRVVKNPEHGIVAVNGGEGYSSHASENPRHQCDFHPTSGVNAAYISAPGHAGPDSLAVDVFVGGKNASCVTI